MGEFYTVLHTSQRGVPKTKEKMKMKVINVNFKQVLDIEAYEIIRAVKDLKKPKAPTLDDVTQELLVSGIAITEDQIAEYTKF